MKYDEMIKELKEIRESCHPEGKRYLALTQAIMLAAHKTKLIIFDMDDVLWDLNEYAASLVGVPYEKFTMWSVYKNPNFTETERKKILNAYTNPNLYQNIRFKTSMVKLINRIHNERPDCTVLISSNCVSEEIRDMKKEQLLRVLDIPEENIHLHLIDMETQSEQKEFPDNVFLLVDDSPCNIAISNALHKIMPAKPYNQKIKGVDHPETDEQLEELVMKYIKAD